MKRRGYKMKSTGIVRNIDRLGRVVLPMELRRMLGINIQDPVEIFTEGNSVVIRKYRPSCVFCSSDKKITVFHGINVCENCVKELCNSSDQLQP